MAIFPYVHQSLKKCKSLLPMEWLYFRDPSAIYLTLTFIVVPDMTETGSKLFWVLPSFSLIHTLAICRPV